MILTFLTEEEIRKLPPYLIESHLLFEIPKIKRTDIENIIERTIFDLDEKYSDSVIIKISFDKCIFCVYLELYFKYSIARIGGNYSVDWIIKYKESIEDEIIRLTKILYKQI